ncbi:MAG: methyltransferase domain-containing protein, partial [bacterium]
LPRRVAREARPRATIGEPMQQAKMPEEHYLSLMQLEDEYWWHQSRYRAVWEALWRHRPPMPTLRIADIGCGTGGFLRFLRARGFQCVTGYDFSDAALGGLQERGIRGHVVDLEKPFVLADGPADVIVALDVMEHIADEARFLRAVAANLSPGGTFVVTVPGHSFLFSDWDRQLNHFRRYSRPDLRRRLERSGLRVIESSHFFSFGVPLGLVRKWFGRYDLPGSCEFPPVPAALNSLLKGLANLERAYLRVGSLPFGTSLLAVTRYRGHEPEISRAANRSPV